MKHGINIIDPRRTPNVDAQGKLKNFKEMSKFPSNKEKGMYFGTEAVWFLSMTFPSLSLTCGEMWPLWYS